MIFFISSSIFFWNGNAQLTPLWTWGADPTLSSLKEPHVERNFGQSYVWAVWTSR